VSVPNEWLTACIERSQSPDEQERKRAWDEIAAFLWPKIMTMAIRMVRRSWHVPGSWQTAEDIASNTFIVLMRQLHTLEDTSRLMGYIHVVLQRQMLARWHKTRREALTDIFPEIPYHGLNTGSSITTQLRFEIAKLPRAQRRVIHARYWLDLEGPACAAALGVSRGTVWNHLRAAHARLKQGLLDAGFSGIEDVEVDRG
jgi:RNA polymerase sigma factor (sigma-70 family)